MGGRGFRRGGNAFYAAGIRRNAFGYGALLPSSSGAFLNIPPCWLWRRRAICRWRRGSTGILAVCRVLTPILIIGGLLLGLYSVLGYARGQETAGLLLQPLSVFRLCRWKTGRRLFLAVSYMLRIICWGLRRCWPVWRAKCGGRKIFGARRG